MRKSKSWAQLEYEYVYRQMRSGFSFETIYERDEIAIGHVKAADYSYQAKDYQEMGWSGEMRRHRFHAIKYRILSRRDAPENNPPPIQIDLLRW